MTAADAQDWDGSYAGPSPPWDIGRPQPAFVRLADAGALTGSLLDAGCGTGAHTILAARHGARALGIDVSPRAIEIARRKTAESGVDTSFRVLNALHLVTLGEAFDTIVDSGLFHVFDNAARTRYVCARRPPSGWPPSPHVLQRPPARRLGPPARHRGRVARRVRLRLANRLDRSRPFRHQPGPRPPNR